MMKNSLVKIMKYKSNKALIQFAYRFLENQGAVLQRNDNGFEVLMPRELSEVLGTGEHIDICGQDLPKEGAYSINYGSLLLERMVSRACRDITVLAYRFEVDYLKKEGFERLINENFIFSNSAGKIENQAEIRASYIFLTCRYTAQSDEQKQGLVNLVFNMETGAGIPEMAGLIFASGKNFTRTDKVLLKDKHLERIMKYVKGQLKFLLIEELKPFYETMARRFRRDSLNLEEYYTALEKEMKKNLKRHSLSEKLVEERQQKIRLLPAELERKRNDLFKKYSIRVNIEPCAAVVINTPAVKVIYNIIGKDRNSVSFTYNPVTMALDPVVCQGCKRSTHNIYFCGSRHLLCPACSSKCPLC